MGYRILDAVDLLEEEEGEVVNNLFSSLNTPSASMGHPRYRVFPKRKRAARGSRVEDHEPSSHSHQFTQNLQLHLVCLKPPKQAATDRYIERAYLSKVSRIPDAEVDPFTSFRRSLLQHVRTKVDADDVLDTQLRIKR